MSYIQKIAALSILINFSLITNVKSESIPFYESIAKTQKQKYTEASDNLEALGRRLKKQGDTSNAYRSLATAAYIRYERDSLLTYKRTGSHGAKPDWVQMACWGGGPGTDSVTGQTSCKFGAGWVYPSTSIKNFGGLVVLENLLGYYDGAGISGVLDTVVVPKLRNNETVEQLCEITGGGKKGQGALAIATYDSKLKKFTRIRQAWYTDFKAKRILSVDPKQVKCKTIEET
jgi:hypothetical protein